VNFCSVSMRLVAGLLLLSQLAASTGSCTERCGKQSPQGCWCDVFCKVQGDCCSDVDTCAIQLKSQSTCKDSCGGKSASGQCWCDEKCAMNQDCCEDFSQFCAPKTVSSCKSSCGSRSANGLCWCDEKCDLHNDCCSDFKDVCKPATPGSCQGKCGMYGGGCWCDHRCEKSGDCCEDASLLCPATAIPAVKSCPKECACSLDPEFCCEDKWDYMCEQLSQGPQCSKQCSSGGIGEQDLTSGSCFGQCGSLNKATNCWCDFNCARKGDCCLDFFAVCNVESLSTGAGSDPEQNNSSTKSTKIVDVFSPTAVRLSPSVAPSNQASITLSPSAASKLCPEFECGPKPVVASRTCQDGVTRSGVGPCAKDKDGVCSWEVRTCPSKPGLCPSLPVVFSQRSFTEDVAVPGCSLNPLNYCSGPDDSCPGSQKCCSILSGCGFKQCVSPDAETICKTSADCPTSHFCAQKAEFSSTKICHRYQTADEGCAEQEYTPAWQQLRCQPPLACHYGAAGKLTLGLCKSATPCDPNPCSSGQVCIPNYQCGTEDSGCSKFICVEDACSSDPCGPALICRATPKSCAIALNCPQFECLQPGQTVVESAAPKISVLFVNSKLVACGDGLNKNAGCLQVRQSPLLPWRTYQGPIVGFDWTPGTVHKLEVLLFSTTSTGEQEVATLLQMMDQGEEETVEDETDEEVEILEEWKGLASSLAKIKSQELKYLVKSRNYGQEAVRYVMLRRLEQQP